MPATERGRRARADIVTAAATLMYQRGVRSTSLDEVLAAAGCGKSQLYHYFDGKTDLVAAVIERQLEFVLAAQPALIHIESWATFDEWLAAILRMHGQPGGPFACPLGTLAAELKNDESFRPHLEAAFGRWMTLLAAGLHRMRDRGDLVAEADPQRLASNIIAALQGGMVVGRVRADITPMRDAVEAAQVQLRRWSTSAADHPSPIS
ncbi:putative transcriptional regulator, TetR family protein [Mycolicibacterium cyprinidarum]|uniref:Transcriptional regulator, TetR family protein n=1 Tax=Mycolicibacterium cyprinidarum TaxID=2860311 RepID=A0ABQ4VC62_9MYCO|nr:putative transcriptional regulator, TetR family protein [Mycolicibacterium sp. NGTWS0302]GJF17498.1 putative transcriptional regulator, TetR family protein [Mycolicibacterium sp. NGTWSNA01]GJF18567.1 putative transcriptional regulator, TetR family protein [Mycolicibacterium sp. NGTWS1803]